MEYGDIGLKTGEDVIEALAAGARAFDLHKAYGERIAGLLADALDLQVAATPLTFARLRSANVERCEAVFHRLDRWNALEWIAAVAGEVGEAANLIKKLHRGDFGSVAGADAERRVLGTLAANHHIAAADGATLRDLIAAELADVACYVDLTAARLKIDLGEAVRAKFNVVSKRKNSAIRL